jgi:serine/threonine protein kinase
MPDSAGNRPAQDMPTQLGSAPPPPGTEAVDSDQLTTGAAPPLPPLTIDTTSSDPTRPGARLDDFEILSELGAGSFGKVLLARQVSLDRCVALKVSARRGAEARTLASLEHDHIVRVFSEAFNQEFGLLLVCMQYVAGTTLDRVIRSLAQRRRGSWSGRTILEAIDALSTQPTAFDPAALRDRDVLASSDFTEAVCWIGHCLALALAHAHTHGVLHRDIKPANILLNRYGRPLLADFNMAFDPRVAGRDEGVGGTLAYMAPEHLEAFHPEHPTPPELVDERSDIYSLGVVLGELRNGQRPFERLPQPGELIDEVVEAMVEERRAGDALADAVNKPALDRVIGRCLLPDPARRYQTAGDLADALEGCRELHWLDKRLPAPGPLTRPALTHPFLWMALLAVGPHVVGSIVNISYNALRIVLTPEQSATMWNTVTPVYNLVIYPLALFLLYKVLAPVVRAWRLLERGQLNDEGAAQARRYVLRLPLATIFLSALGWLPGGVIFPLALDRLSGPLPAGVAGHFFISFTISGLIAMTYSVLAVQFIVLRVLYPRLWGDGRDLLQGAAAQELRFADPELLGLQILAGAIPLAGAVLMVGAGPEEFTAASYRDFRVLVTALILLGMAGFTVAVGASNLLGKVVAAFRAAGRRRRAAADGEPTPPSARPVGRLSGTWRRGSARWNSHR